MKVYKILLKETKEENKWGYEVKGEVHMGEVAFPFTAEDMELKKGDILYYQDDYAKKVTIDGKEYISTNPVNIICQK